MSKIAIIGLLFSGLSMIGCSDNDKSLGIEKSSIVKQDTLYKFYKTGKLKGKCKMVNGKLHGWCKEFYESGNLKIYYYFHNDSILGPASHYFDMNDTFLIKESGEYYKYFEPKINKYQFFNDLQQIVFKVEYDSSGEIISQFGSTIISYFSPKDIRSGKNTFYFEVPTPPKCLVNFRIIDNENTIYEINTVRNSKIKFDKVFNENNKEFYWTCISTILSEKEETVLDSDTLYLSSSDYL